MMTSSTCTQQQQFNKIMFAKKTNGPPSESQSEISSVDSDWSDIRTIAMKLGVQNPTDLLTERFKIDRQKLENMIKSDSSVDGWNSAEYFFDDIMQNTTTYISWPCRLKIGAKSKKDPHVRIVGKPDDVNRAKERILASLDSRGTRVIMKIDVSYTDHSYIIGRCGNNIKRIMEDTATHIHFPDSNRCNPVEKSNQVSLCGSLDGVEKARALVRLSTPLLISFELPIMAQGRQGPDHDTPYIKDIELKYNVQVIFSTRPKLHSSLVLVKGSEKEALNVQEATQALINFTCENIANQILVQMQLEISPQHHEVVKGKNSMNLLNIMERTKTKIIFTDVHDMNIKPIKKSQVTITGTIDGVYQARQQLIGNLPIALIFDYPYTHTEPTEIINLSNKFGVFISLRQKQRQSTMAVVIKGVEKFINKVYEARHEVLNLSNLPIVVPVIPKTYFSPKDHDFESVYRQSLTALLAKYPESPLTPGYNLYNQNNNNNSNNNNNNNNNNNGIINSNNNLTPIMNSVSPYQHLSQQFQTTPTGICSSNQQKLLQIHNNLLNNKNNYHQQHRVQQMQQHLNHNNNLSINVATAISNSSNSSSNNNSNSNCISNFCNNNFNHFNLNNNNLIVPSSASTQSLSPRNSSNNTSGYQSFSSSTTSLEQAYPPYMSVNGNIGTGGAVTVTTATSSTSNRSHYSPDSTINSNDSCGAGGGGGGGVGIGNFKGGRRFSDSGMLNVTDYKRISHFDMKLPQQHAFDFDMKRVDGFKAMERLPQYGEMRTPNSNWMGLGLSRTSPVPLETVDDMTGWSRNSNNNNSKNNENNDGRVIRDVNDSNNSDNFRSTSPYSLGATTGIVDALTANRRMQLSHHKDIHSLLTGLGLEHYIKTFVLNEIDLEIFTSLTEDNLTDLGITTFGARKKLIAAIHTLASQYDMRNLNMSPRFSGSAAPGAERRPSSGW